MTLYGRRFALICTGSLLVPCKGHKQKHIGIRNNRQQHQKQFYIWALLEPKCGTTIRTGGLMLCPAVNTMLVEGMTTCEGCRSVYIFVTDRAFHYYDQSIIIPLFLFIWFGFLGEASHVSSYSTLQSGNLRRKPSTSSSGVGM